MHISPLPTLQRVKNPVKSKNPENPDADDDGFTASSGQQ
jgi:hypothetical protein